MAGRPHKLARKAPGTPSKARTRQRLSIELVIEAGDWTSCEPLEPLVAEVAAAIIAELDVGAPHVSAVLALSSDAHVRALNRAHRGIDEATNVLSFQSAIPVGVDDQRPIGDIVLAQETLEREAREGGIPLRDHVRHLVVHGVLHLLGYDHGADKEAAVMEGLETGILAGLGVADPYADDNAAGGR